MNKLSNTPRLIKKCTYSPKIKLDTVDIYKNNELSQALEYSADDSDACLGLQTSYNLFSGIESSGSSYKYTIDVPLSGGVKNDDYITDNSEFFNMEQTMSKIEPTYIYIAFIILIMMLLVYTKNNEL